jgi:hypothetical protein
MRLAGHQTDEAFIVLGARPTHHVPEGELKVPGGAGVDGVTAGANRPDDRCLLHGWSYL